MIVVISHFNFGVDVGYLCIFLVLKYLFPLNLVNGLDYKTEVACPALTPSMHGRSDGATSLRRALRNPYHNKGASHHSSSSLK